MMKQKKDRVEVRRAVSSGKIRKKGKFVKHLEMVI